MSNISATPTATGGRTVSPVGGQAIGQVINPPPRLPQLAAAGAVIRAVVLGEDGPGQLRLSSDLGQLTLRSSLRLPPGSVVSLQLRPIGGEVHVLLLADQGRAAERWQPPARVGPAIESTVEAAATAAAGAPAAIGSGAVSLAAGRWPALEAILRQLSGEGNGGRAAPAALPHAGRRLAAAWQGLASALSAGELRAWLGSPAAEAEAADGELRRDIARLAALAGEPDAEGWRHLALPLLAEGRLTLLWLHLRGDSAGSEDAEAGTRFLLDLDFSALGPIQLDGLLHGPRFDLVLRSHRPLPETLREDISAMQREAARLAGLHGRLQFRVEEEWRPLPPPAALLAEGSLLV